MQAERMPQSLMDLLVKMLYLTGELKVALSTLERDASLGSGRGLHETPHQETYSSPGHGLPCPGPEQAQATLANLAEEQAAVLDLIIQAGPSSDPNLLPLVQDTWQEVQDVMARLESCRERTLEVLGALSRHRSRTAAYATQLALNVEEESSPAFAMASSGRSDASDLLQSIASP